MEITNVIYKIIQPDSTDRPILPRNDKYFGHFYENPS